MGDLLKATELVQRLGEEGLGKWKSASVYKWLLWSPPLPIARMGGPGVPHLFDLEEVLAWLAEHQERVSGWNGVNAGEAFTDPRMEKARQEARVAKMKADQIEGLTIPRDLVQTAWLNAVIGARTVLLQAPERLAHSLGIPTAERERFVAGLRAELDKVMRRLGDGDMVLSGLVGEGQETMEDDDAVLAGDRDTA